MSSTLPSQPEFIDRLNPNDVLARAPEKKDKPPTYHRVLWISYADRQAVLLDLEKDSALREPYFQSLDEIEQLVGSGSMYRSTYFRPDYMLLSEEEIPQKYRTVRDQHWSLIESLLDPTLQPDIFRRETRGPLVTRIAKANQKTRKAILRLLYRAYKYGGEPAALLPKWPNCGGPGNSRAPKDKKRGRKPKVVTTGHATEKVGINVDENIKKKILLGVDTFCKLDDRVSIAKAYRDTKDRFFVSLKEMPNGEMATVPMPADQVPKIGQFYYYAKQRIESLGFARKRLGEIHYAQNARPIVGTAQSRLLGPGHLYEIDSTIADIYLISRYNPEWVIGRPVIYVVIDTFSRLIVGLYIGLIGPSWEGARLALANALTNKVVYCAEHGVTIALADWPSCHFPYSIAADRAELLCTAAEAALRNMRIELATPGPYRADWKGVVERRFRILNDVVIDWIPGAVRQRQRDMRRRGYILDATLNIDEFTRVIINCVLEHNLCVRREELPTKEMVAANVNPYSIDIWNWGVANLTGPLRTEDPDLVRTHLLPTTNATVTPSGIICNGMPYTCDRAISEGWFERARRFKSWSVPVKTQHLTNTIYLAPPAVKRYEPCHLIDPQERYQNKRIEEAVDYLEFIRLSRTDFADRDEQIHHAYQADSNSVIQRAIDRKRKKSRSSPTKPTAQQIRQQRSIEAEAARVIENRNTESSSATVTPIHNDTRRATPPAAQAQVIDLLRVKRDKHWEMPK